MKNKIFKTIMICVLILIAGFTIYRFFGKNLDFKGIKEYFEYNIKYFINSFGKLGWLMFILVFTLRTLLVVFPYSIMVLIGGGLFGYVTGFMISLVSVFLSASLAYFLSKKFGTRFSGKILKGKFEKIDLSAGEHGFKIIFIMRISLLFPFDISNFAVGLTKIKYKDFILGTMLGILPETFSLTLLGNNIDKPMSTSFFISLGMVIITIIVPILFNKFKKKELNSDQI